MPLRPGGGYFYSFQLHGISYDAGGETVGIHVFDATYDASAYGSVSIFDATTNTTLYSFTSGDYGNYSSPASYDSPTFLLPYGDLLQYAFAGQEYSGMKIFFGGTEVASGGTAYGQYPIYSTSEVISNPNSVPDATNTIGLLAFAFGGVLALRRKFGRA